MSPWGMPPPPATPSPLGGSQFDSFLSSPAAAAAPHPSPPMLQSPPAPLPPREIQAYSTGSTTTAVPTTNTTSSTGAVIHRPPSTTTTITTATPSATRTTTSSSSHFQPAPDSTAPPPGTTYPPQCEYGQKKSPSAAAVGADASGEHHHHQLSPAAQVRAARNAYSEELARQAPPGASALPRADLVGKKVYVLSRISFRRTIVMKKWKQSFWIQYGPHTMLWFRSQADYEDWLNNPYHMQAERNYLIKLAVNFVHDLYKPNVRGYQVTQCRTKGYGNKMVRQFKLERWMDYGPTIAGISRDLS